MLDDNISTAVQVRVQPKTTRFTFERMLLSIRVTDITALATTLRSISGIDVLHVDAFGHRLIRQELFELIERPIIEQGALFFA